jgi:hypothetical protein
MAETAYERFLKDVKDNEAVDIEIRDPKPLSIPFAPNCAAPKPNLLDKNGDRPYL